MANFGGGQNPSYTGPPCPANQIRNSEVGLTGINKIVRSAIIPSYVCGITIFIWQDITVPRAQLQSQKASDKAGSVA